ncbi:MAG: hypothetical protein M3N26_08285, partial [Pseudomonadota bacterium]|nr:hypothetical protein [Pseudomonadota bacterium]
MSWTVGPLDGVEAGLRALVSGREVVAVEQADVVLWPARRLGAMPVGAGLNVIDLRGVDPAEDIALAGAGLLLVGSAAAYGAWAIKAR